MWKFTLSNLGTRRADRTQINIFLLTQSNDNATCHPRVIGQLSINVGDVAPGTDANVAVPIDFSRYSDSARFNVSLVFSANNGADVGNVIETNETK